MQFHNAIITDKGETVMQTVITFHRENNFWLINTFKFVVFGIFFSGIM